MILKWMKIDRLDYGSPIKKNVHNYNRDKI